MLDKCTLALQTVIHSVKLIVQDSAAILCGVVPCVVGDSVACPSMLCTVSFVVKFWQLSMSLCMVN